MAPKSDASNADRDARMRALVDQLPAVVWSTDDELRFTSSRGGGLATLGLQPDQVVGITLYEYFQTRDDEFAPIKAHHRALAGESVSYEVEWAGRHFETYTEPFRDERGRLTGTLSIALDVTERKQAETARRGLELKLREQHRLEAVGQLAAGLAHEINNPLQSIMNFAQLIRSRGQIDLVREYAEEIVNEVHGLAAIVRNLQRLVHEDGELPSEVRLQDVVEGTVSLFRAALRKERIDLQVDVPEDLPAVWCRARSVQQALINLVTSARDALNHRYPRGDADKRMRILARPSTALGHASLRLTVEDRGTPIPESTIARLFEPFTLVAGREQGSGLGLSISRAIVRENGGELSVEVQGESGQTTFHLDLPLSAEQ